MKSITQQSRAGLLTAAVAITALTLLAGPMGVNAAAIINPFTQTELETNWEGDRYYPTGDVDSVTAFGRTNVARLGIDAEETQAATFQRTEGIKTVGDQNFGDSVKVDLYIDPDWEGKAVRAGLWVVGDDGNALTTGTASRDNWFGILEFVNLETSVSGASAQANHEGFRIWDSEDGWTNVSATPFVYGEWVTLEITLDPDAETYTYRINGSVVGTATAGDQYIREVFLNSYNYGEDVFPELDSSSYAAHWNVLSEPVSKLECTKDAWKQTGFKNQGQCVRFVQTGKDSR